MIEIDERSVVAWREAAADLDIRVEAPCVRGNDGHATAYGIAYVPDFGWPAGTLVNALAAGETERAFATQHGYSFCTLNPHIFGVYDRAEWIALLEYFRWFGAGRPPSWYAPHSTWKDDPLAVEVVRSEMVRIHGSAVELEDWPPFYILGHVSHIGVLQLLDSVPPDIPLEDLVRRRHTLAARVAPLLRSPRRTV